MMLFYSFLFYFKDDLMKRIRFVLILVVSCLILSLAAPFASALDAPRLKSADAYLLVDMNTGTEIISLNPDMEHSIASLTKIMTCLLAVEAVENGSVRLTDMVTAQDDCLQGLDTSSSNAGIKPGETMSFKDLLYCALVHSANDACNVIATHIAGSISSFVQMMNARAEELGCEKTHYMDTDGMFNRSDGHYSSPRDLYIIGSEAMKHPLFAEICGTADYTVSATNYREAFEIHNSNALMSTGGIYGDSYKYNGVSGIKTGFTKPAGYCLVSVCERNGERLMCIVLGCNGPLTYTFAGEYQNFEDSTTLYDWAFANFRSQTVFLAGEPLKRVPVTYARDNGTVALCASDSVNLFLSKEITEQDIRIDIHPEEDKLVAPIKAGDEIGTADVYISGELRRSVRLLADSDVEMERIELIKAKIKAFFTSTGFRLAVILLLAAVILFFLIRGFRKTARRRILHSRIAEKEQAKWTEQRAVYAAKGNSRRQQNSRSVSSAAPVSGPVQNMPTPQRRTPIVTVDLPRTASMQEVAEEDLWSGQRFVRPSVSQRRPEPQPAASRPAREYVPSPANLSANPSKTPQSVPENRVRSSSPVSGRTGRIEQTGRAGRVPSSESAPKKAPVFRSFGDSSFGDSSSDFPRAVTESAEKKPPSRVPDRSALLRSREQQRLAFDVQARERQRKAFDEQPRQKPVIHEAPKKTASVPEASPEPEFDLEDILNSFK